MQLRSDIQLTSVIKSLSEVIAPAIDPSDSLAREQVQIVINLLKLMADRLPQQFGFDCDELARLQNLAGNILACAGDAIPADSLSPVSSAATNGADVLERAKADPAEVLAAVRRLRSVCSETTTLIYESAPVKREELKTVILAYSAEQLLRDRSWVLSQGWEKRPETVPDIVTLMAPRTT